MPELFDVHTPPNAWRRFSAAFQPTVRSERVAVIDALGRVLAVELIAPHDLPSFRRSTVDGYAVAAQDTHGASDSLPAYLEVADEVPMGQAAVSALDEGQCAIVHTGGMIPADADAVVMVEHTQRVSAPDPPQRRTNPPAAAAYQSTNPPAAAAHQSTNFPTHTIEVYRPAATGQNVIQVGEDVRQGEAVLPVGHVVRPQDIGGLLALGIVEIDVAVRPRVAILSQGDEVTPPDQEPGPGQVRDINSYTLAALALQAGAEPLTFPIVPDRLEALQAAAAQALAQADVLVMSAGSSVSVRDMTAQVIDGLGQPGILVHGVSVKPGKPTILAICNDKPVFGLPGNPVSAMVIFDLLVAPAIRRLLGAAEPRKNLVSARLARNIASATGREDIVQVRLETRPASGRAGAAPYRDPEPFAGRAGAAPYRDPDPSAGRVGAAPYRDPDPSAGRVGAAPYRDPDPSAGRVGAAPYRDPDPELWAVPVLGKSNLIYTLIRSEGIVRVPLDSNGIAQGEWVTVEMH
ncbi:MAG: gephyrin-like molybdotransferase Glp [Anaerolineae bacterium]